MGCRVLDLAFFRLDTLKDGSMPRMPPGCSLRPGGVYVRLPLSAEGGNRWMMGNKPLTLLEILDLSMEGTDEGLIDYYSLLQNRKMRDKENGRDVNVTVCCQPGGTRLLGHEPGLVHKVSACYEGELGI